MLQEFAKHVQAQEGKTFDPIADRIRQVFICHLCLFRPKCLIIDV